MKTGTISKAYQGPAIHQRYFTPSEAQIPTLSYLQKHEPISILNYKNQKTAEIKITDEGLLDELDGFLLLEATGSEFPEDAQQVMLVDKRLASVVEDDLPYFSELIIADVSENNLSLESFGALPALQDLRIACNRISIINELRGFDRLQYLDLSYNRLNINSVQNLDGIPNLKELDLCGNNLGGLPPMSNFLKLEKILLEYNKIDDGAVFSVLSNIPNLRHVGLANNFLSRIPSDACYEGSMRLVEVLDLAFNYFNSEDELMPLTTLPRLVTLMLYGNPVLGPSGEDPMYIYIESLVEQGYQQRNGSNIKDIDFVTEIPRRRVLKKGQQLGRLAAYRDFSITQVDTTISTKSAREWKKSGSSTLFAEAVAAVKKPIPYASHSGDPNAVLPDFTFITNSESIHNSNPYSNKGRANKTDAIADDVMKQVAAEMGLLNSAELIYLRDKAKLPPTAESIDRLFHEDRPPITTIIQQTTAIPDHFYGQKTISTPAAAEIVAAQPIALQTAMRALQLAIRQPLTDYDEIYDSKMYVRPTKSSKSWQVPRGSAANHANQASNNLAVVPKSSAMIGASSGSKSAAVIKSTAGQDIKKSEGKDEDYPDRQLNKFKMPGLPESIAVKQRRTRNRDHTLSKIDQVLDSLNDYTETMASSAPLQQMSAKDTIKQYKGFVKPYPAGIKNLMDMVDEVVNDFQK